MTSPMVGLAGNQWVPNWAVRPGSFSAVRHISRAMPLWLLMHSRTDGYFVPCLHNREQLGATIGRSRASVSRHLRVLSEAALLFELKRGIEPKTRRHRPPARWPLDPFADEVWRPKVEEAIIRLAESDGQRASWVHDAWKALDHFHRRSRRLHNALAEDMIVKPKPRRRRRKQRKRGSKRT